jgi:uncharacterized protein
MKPQIYYVAALAYVDSLLDDLNDEQGDLPQKVQSKEKYYEDCVRVRDETASIIEEIKSFLSKTKITLVELKDKEDSLSKQQFNVRNNKEFDAITKEIAYLKSEHEKLSEQMRVESVKYQNLQKIYEQQQIDAAKALVEFETLQKQMDELASEQNEEVVFLINKRKAIITKISSDIYRDYSRIRAAFPDAAVRVRKNSCAGNTVPSQTLVELRNNLDMIFHEEQSGRIMIPEEMIITDADIDEID